MGQWRFEEQPKGAVRRDPNESVLFKTEQAGEGEYAGNDALVREILQNAVDARVSREPVRVRFAIHEKDEAPSKARLAYYFKRLQPALALKQIECDGSGVPNLPCRFLVCEDFGTRGLEGDIELFGDPQESDKTRQDFYWFWRNIGRSAKTGDDLGRWGLGKTVYRAVSRVGCMLGLTVRKSDRQRLLMGQAVLQIHRFDRKEHMAEGYWCGDTNAAGLPMPIDDHDELDEFAAEWRLTRSDEPGLSIVAPFVPEELRADRILQAVAVHFFARILRGELVVEVVGNGIGSVTLDKRGLQMACEQITWDGPKRTKRHVAPPISFAKRCLSEEPATTTRLLGEDRMPDLTDNALPEATLAKLRKDYAGGLMTSLRVRVWLLRHGGDGQEGVADVFLQRLSDGARCDAYYVREGMTITKINSRAALRGVQALVNVEPGPLAKLLGDTENPAHEDWDTSADRPDKEWWKWKGRVKFVRYIVDSLVELLTPPKTEPDFDFLADFFSIERMGGGKKLKPEGPDTKKPEFPSPGEPKWYHITERAGGFTVGRNNAVEKPEEAKLRVSVAYDLPKGDPLSNWNPLDFILGMDAGQLRPKGKGARVRLLQGNVLLLEDLNEEFRVSVEGFDRYRDLYIRLDDVTGVEEALP